MDPAWLFHGTTEEGLEDILREGLAHGAFWGNFRVASYFAYAQMSLPRSQKDLAGKPLYVVAKRREELGELEADPYVFQLPVSEVGMPEAGEFPRLGARLWREVGGDWRRGLELSGSVHQIARGGTWPGLGTQGEGLKVDASEVVALRCPGYLDYQTDWNLAEGERRYQGAIKKWDKEKGMVALWACGHEHGSATAGRDCAALEAWGRWSRQVTTREWRAANGVEAEELFWEVLDPEAARAHWAEVHTHLENRPDDRENLEAAAERVRMGVTGEDLSLSYSEREPEISEILVL